MKLKVIITGTAVWAGVGDFIPVGEVKKTTNLFSELTPIN
jgi:hypothetical protein